MYIFLDESGDLGFTHKSSRFFVISGVIVLDNPKRLRKLMKMELRRINRKLKGKKKFKELKFHLHKSFAKKILEKIASLSDVRIKVGVVDKKSVYKYLHDRKEVYYNYLAGIIISGMLSSSVHDKVFIVLDKRSFQKAQAEFNDYVSNKLFYIFGRRFNLEFIHINSDSDPGLWAADLAVGAIHARYKDSDESFYKLIEKITNVEELHWPIKTKK